MPDDPAHDLNGRQREMVDLVRQQGFVAIEALAEHFGVTSQTIRRDVNALCRGGLLRRYHGGAGLPSSVENEAYTARRVQRRAEKQRIARALARQIPNQASVFMTLGTTTEEVARALMDHRGLRVITNNLHVANILADNQDCEVIVAGGVLRSRDRGIVGEATVEFIGQFKVDIGLIGISGIEADGTLRDFDFREVKVARTIIEHSREVWLAADASKFNRQAMVELAHLSQIDRLFTDEPLRAPFEQIVADSGVKCVVAAE